MAGTGQQRISAANCSYIDLAQFDCYREKLERDLLMGSHPKKIAITIVQTQYGMARARTNSSKPQDVPYLINDMVNAVLAFEALGFESIKAYNDLSLKQLEDLFRYLDDLVDYNLANNFGCD